MSRPPISYPTPLPGSNPPSTYTTRSNLDANPSHEPTERRPSGSRPGHRPSGSRSNVGTLDSHITKLLLHTKHMLLGVNQWAKGEIDEVGVSDIFVKLGNEFETCVGTFRRAGLDVVELEKIPDHLRVCLEQCLAEEPSPESLSLYLPDIQSIIYNLLNGLKQKQVTYRHVLEQRSRTATPSPIPQPPPQLEDPLPPPPPIPDPSSARLSARSGTSTAGSLSSTSPGSTSSQLPPHMPRVPSSMALAERARTASRPAPPDAFRPPRRAQEPPRRTPSPQPGQPLPVVGPDVVRHRLVDNPVPTAPAAPISMSLDTPPRPPPKPIPHPDRFSRDSLGRQISRFSMDSEVTNGSPIRSIPSSSPAKSMRTLQEDDEDTPAAAPPPSLPTLNLPTSGLGLSDVSDEAPVAPAEVPIETRRTLAALGRSDALERRASKRFSSYTFNKLPGSPNHKKTASSNESPQRPTRRVDRVPPMPMLPESLASSNLATNAVEGSRQGLQPSALLPPNGDSTEVISSPQSGRTVLSDSASQDGSVRVVKTPEPEDMALHATPRPGATTPPSKPADPTSISLFLQIGRQVKKAKIDLPVSLSSLRLLFMERFDYDPGVDNFPDVYIRDPATGVQFELEQMDDLKDGSVLSLDIEPLDQVKQHVDLKFANMLQELKDGLKDMKSALDNSRRHSAIAPAPSLLAPSPSLGRSGGRVGESTPQTSPSATRAPLPPLVTDNAASKGVSASEAQIRAQLDEIQALRRDLGIMRQVHVDFLTETKEAFSKLRQENNTMRDLVKTKMGGSRALLDNSKAKLELLCADTITAVEEVSDVIDAAREDAFKRFVHPTRTQMKKIQADLKNAHDLIDAFAKEVASIEPTWRATWHHELSRVMDEQKLLPHQTKLAVDLKSDIADAEEMFKNVSDFVDQRTTNAAKGVRNAYRPPTPDEGSGGVQNLLMEIRTKEADPNQRLRAIEAQQKAREKEKANKTDEFQDELSGFVQGRKLKKTGGTDEVERQRQRKQEQTIKRMLSGETSMGSPTGNGAGPVGLLSPQATGASLKSQSSVRSQTTLPGGGSRTSRGEEAAHGGEDKEEIKEEVKQEP